MLQDIQRASAPALHELLSTVSALRHDILAESEELYHSWRSRIERSAFVPSAQNLAAYLALRRRDLRTLQASLMRWGLSSLGRSESRVIATLDAVVASLGSICAVTRPDVPDYPDEQRMFAGAKTIAQAADSIFGRYTGRVRRASWSRSPRKRGRSRGSSGHCCRRASSVCGLTVPTTILTSGLPC